MANISRFIGGTAGARSPRQSTWSFSFRKKLTETGGRSAGPFDACKRCDRAYVARASAPCQEEVSRRERDLPWPVGAAPRTPRRPYSTPIEPRSSLVSRRVLAAEEESTVTPRVAFITISQMQSVPGN